MALEAAKDVAAGPPAREASHIAFFDLVFAGRTDAAIVVVRSLSRRRLALSHHYTERVWFRFLSLRRLHDMKVTTAASAVIFLLRTKGFACPEFTLETGPSQRAAQLLVSVSFSIYRLIGSTDKINPE